MIWSICDKNFNLVRPALQFSPKNVIFGVKIMQFLIPGQNFGIFVSPTKGMDTFLFEMSMKWMFTFKNFRNVYWHGKTHSALYPSWPNLLGDRPSITFWGFFCPDESVGHQIIANWYLILLWVKNLYRKDIHLRYLGGARLLAGATEILFVHSCQVLL